MYPVDAGVVTAEAGLETLARALADPLVASPLLKRPNIVSFGPTIVVDAHRSLILRTLFPKVLR